jgi:hypothetical protein
VVSSSGGCGYQIGVSPRCVRRWRRCWGRLRCSTSAQPRLPKHCRYPSPLPVRLGQADDARAPPSGTQPPIALGMDRAVPYTAPCPASIGYHPGRNALIAIATDSAGQITGGQFIHLDRHGHKLAKAEAHVRPTAKGRPSSACAGCAPSTPPGRCQRS